jgi:hypothetical protein
MAPSAPPTATQSTTGLCASAVTAAARAFLDSLAPDLVGEVFHDRQAVPYHRLAVPQDRHLAAGGLDLAHVLLQSVPLLAHDRNGELVEMQARLLDREPAAQAPARIVLVADDEFHVRLLHLAGTSCGPP